MSCITKLLELKGDKPCLPINGDCVIEGGGIYKYYEYLITFTSNGTRCGYVALKPEEVAIFEEEKKEDAYYYPDIECHGGATFYANDHGAKDLLPVFCTDTWIGFDAHHFRDGADLLLAEKFFPDHRFIEYKKANPESYDYRFSHRTYDFMVNQCELIIEQLLVLTP